MLVVKCVICSKPIKNPGCLQSTCKDLECQDKYRRYLIAIQRVEEKAERIKAKVNKELKIIKTRETKT